MNITRGQLRRTERLSNRLLYTEPQRILGVQTSIMVAASIGDHDGINNILISENTRARHREPSRPPFDDHDLAAIAGPWGR